MGRGYQLTALAAICAGAMGLSSGVLAAERTHQITTDDFFTIGNMGNVQLSPDGKHALWLESRWDKELDKAQKDLWLIDTKSRKTNRLTFTNESESSPQWSPDGSAIYYLVKQSREDNKAPYNGKAQVFRINLGSTEAVPVTKEAEGVKQFQLSQDGKSLYFLTNKTTTDKDI